MNVDTPYNPDEIWEELPELETIASVKHNTAWRAYTTPNNDEQHSEWFTFEEGMQYYMSGSAHTRMSVAVEIMPGLEPVVEEQPECTCASTNEEPTDSAVVTEEPVVDESNSDVVEPAPSEEPAPTDSEDVVVTEPADEEPAPVDEEPAPVDE